MSDETGAFAGERGLRERLGFIYRWPVVERMEVASDLTYDRTKTYKALVDNKAALIEALEACEGDAREFPSAVLRDVRTAASRRRVPHQVESRPYEFMAVNAHLIFR